MAVKLWTVHFMRICVANLLLFISLYVLFPVLPIEIFLIDLCQCLPFNTAAEVFFPQVLMPLLVPKDSILGFGVHNHTVKIE